MQKQEKSFDLFPDFAESAIEYIVTDQTGELTLYTGLYNVSGKYGFLEGTINTFYNVYGGYETNELFIARMSSEDYKSMDLEMRQTSFDNTIESIYCGTPICTIIGVGQFETENNIVSGKQLYKLDIFEKASVLSTNDKPVFAMTSGASFYYYASPVKEDSYSDILWFDEEHKLVFSVNARLDKEDLLRFAKSIQCLEPGWE